MTPTATAAITPIRTHRARFEDGVRGVRSAVGRRNAQLAQRLDDGGESVDDEEFGTPGVHDHQPVAQAAAEGVAPGGLLTDVTHLGQRQQQLLASQGGVEPVRQEDDPEISDEEFPADSSPR